MRAGGGGGKADTAMQNTEKLQCYTGETRTISAI